MFNRNSNNLFRPKRQGLNSETKRFFAIFFSCVLLVLLISCLAILSKYDFNIKSAVSGEAETETVTVTEENEVPEMQGEKTYFFWCAEDDRSSIHFAWLVNINMNGRTMRVFTVTPETVVDFEGEAASLERVYSQAGANELAAAVERASGIELDGYAGSDGDSFRAMINSFGGVDVTVPEQVEYRGEGLTLVLVKGKQNMKGDTLYKYMLYLESLGAKGRSMQANVLNEIFKSVFSPSYMNRLTNLFSKFSNTLKTDLTIVDFSQAENAIRVLIEHGFTSMKQVDTPAELIAED